MYIKTGNERNKGTLLCNGCVARDSILPVLQVRVIPFGPTSQLFGLHTLFVFCVSWVPVLVVV